jgi:hypothetical protein
MTKSQKPKGTGSKVGFCQPWEGYIQLSGPADVYSEQSYVLSFDWITRGLTDYSTDPVFPVSRYYRVGDVSGSVFTACGVRKFRAREPEP